MDKRTYSPRNTAQDDSLVKLLVSASDGGIEEQERQGQSEMLASTTLPSECDAAEFEALGFTFGEPVAGDPLFRQATLPAGWKREGSEHAMHSYIVDERGVRRVNVFYKAAFYDRRADMHVLNVGYDIATHVIYGDDKVEVRSDLTADELTDVRESAEAYLRRAEESPRIYGDRVPRAKALLAAVPRS